MSDRENARVTAGSVAGLFFGGTGHTHSVNSTDPHYKVDFEGTQVRLLRLNPDPAVLVISDVHLYTDPDFMVDFLTAAIRAEVPQKGLYKILEAVDKYYRDNRANGAQSLVERLKAD